MNGMTDHIHILLELHPTLSLSDLVKAIKQSSSLWIKQSGHFPLFDRWSEGYFAVSLGGEAVESCKRYIMNQQEHHSKSNFLDEVKYLNARYGLMWEPE